MFRILEDELSHELLILPAGSGMRSLSGSFGGIMPQHKQASFSELRVGILVLISLAILLLVIFAVSGDIKLPGLGTTTIVKTEMASVDGLRKGAEVRLSGVKVGSVKEINFSDRIPDSATAPNNIEILMEIDGRLDGRPAVERIRTDSKAVLKSAGVLGDNVIDIMPGTSAGQPIRNGGRIDSVAQKSVGDILNAANTAMGNLNKISDDVKVMTGQLREGKGSVGKFLNDEAFYLNLDSAVRQAEALITDIKQGPGTVGRLVSDPALYNQTSDTIASLRRISDQVGDQLNNGKGTVGKLFKDDTLYKNANDLVAKLNETSARLERTMARIENGEGAVGKLVKDEKLYNDARDTIEKLKVVATRLEKGEGTAGMLLRDERLYHNVNNLSAEMTKLLYDFRQNPKKYLSVKVALF
jgi:phospholipid/cholesterol/gamma-HCH transport system substrate-binding protein